MGAAMATLISKLIFNFGKFLFLYLKEGLQPFTAQNIKAVIILLAGYVIIELLPGIILNSHIYIESVLNIAYKSLIGFVFVASAIYIVKVSDDVNSFADQLVTRVFKMIKRS